jgi:hypothetical protein
VEQRQETEANTARRADQRAGLGLAGAQAAQLRGRPRPPLHVSQLSRQHGQEPSHAGAAATRRKDVLGSTQVIFLFVSWFLTFRNTEQKL